MESFKTSKSYTTAKEILRMFVLRGEAFDPDYHHEASILNKIYEVHSKIHVINILGHVLNWPLAKFTMSDEQLEKEFQTGDFCIFSEKHRKQLETVVENMKSFRFELIPLVVVTNYEEEPENFETVLIKVHCPNFKGECSYVDISGRTYYSFKHFLDTNKLPYGMLCYPQGGIAEFDENDDLLVDCCEVGLANRVLGGLNAAIGLVGATATIGAIFATGGLAIPFVVTGVASSIYSVGHSTGELVDAVKHDVSLNPLKSAEARNNWLSIAGNAVTLCSFGVAGLAKFSRLKKSVDAVRCINVATGVTHAVFAGVNAVTAIDSISYIDMDWRRMSLQQKIKLTCDICVSFREVINFANAKRLWDACMINGICRFFGNCIEGLETASQQFVATVKKFFEGMQDYVLSAWTLIKTVPDKFNITVSKDFVSFKLFGFEFKIQNIISMLPKMVEKFVYMIEGIAAALNDAFGLMRLALGDAPIIGIVFKEADEMGGNRADFGTVINWLIEVFNLARQFDSISIHTDQVLKIGAGHRFSIVSAYNAFIKNGKLKGISLLRALCEMNSGEVDRMNNLRHHQWEGRDAAIFEFITDKSIGSTSMLSKIRFLLDVSEICTRKSLRTTDLQPGHQIVEIESMNRISLDTFRQAIHPDYLVDPKLLKICQRVLGDHREYIETIWTNTCVQARPEDKAFEKLTALESEFSMCSDETIRSIISYAAMMDCTDFSGFFTHARFALYRIQSMRGMMNAFTKETDFNGNEFRLKLKSRFLDLKTKAEEHSLAGYCALNDFNGCLMDVQPTRLIEFVKGLASQEALRFGTIENGALYLGMHPMLQLRTELQKWNGLIAGSDFEQEEVKPAYAGKRMVLLQNDHLIIVVGLVQGLGAYIDTFISMDMD